MPSTLNSAPSFAIGTGKVTTAIGSSSDNAYSVVVQPDGKILVGGHVFNGINYDFAVVRYNADGTLDSTFGDTGKVITAIGVLDDVAYSIALQPDGKILLAGYSITGSNADFALVRYNSDGTLDTSSGTGKITTDVGSPAGSPNDYGRTITVQPDGKILVAGYGYNNFNLEFAVVRYNPDLSLDPTFDGDGKLTTDVGYPGDYGQSVLVQPDGKILVGGFSETLSTRVFSVVRYNANGSLDTSFGGTGKVTTDVGPGYDTGLSIALQPDGKVLIAGPVSNGTNDDFALVRYNANGTLDTSFGGTGKVLTAVGVSHDYASSVTIQPDGKILVAGNSDNSSNSDFAIVRYNTDGSLDTSFGGTGKVVTAIGTNGETAFSVIVQPDGKIVVAGSTYNGSDSDFAVARYNADGSLDITFDPVNTLDGAPTFTEGGAAVVLDGNAAIHDVELASVGNYDGATLTLVRNGGASAQDTFGASGALSTLTEGGSLLVSGTSIGEVTQNSAGTLILTFNANATETLVNSAMRAITYANSSDNPPVSVQINWSFSDGNTGAQGDGGALAAAGSTTVTIIAVNDAPTAVELQNPAASVAESAPSAEHIKVADIAVTDDGLGTNTLGLTGTDAAFFEIVGSELFLKVGTALDFESKSSYSVAVTIDDASVGSTPDATSATYTLNIADVNETPTAVALQNATASITEETSTADRIKVADIAVTDDALGTNTLGLTGADAIFFEIVGSGLFLKAGTALDFESKNSYSVAVTVDDTNVGGTPDATSATYALNITDANEAPTAVALQNTAASIEENTSTAIHIKVADIAVTDDGLGTNTLGLTGADAAFLEIVGTSLYLKAGTVLDFETKASYSVAVTVDDTSVGNTPDATSATYTLNVSDVNENAAPTAVALQNTTASLAEGTSTAARIKVADIAVTDDGLGTNTLGLTGADAAFFEIDGAALYLKAGTVLDYESKASYAVAVTVDDASVGSTPDATSSTYTLNLTNVTEAPEVAVSGQAIDIADADTSVSTADDTDFGMVLVGTANVVHTFTVQNLGLAPLATSGLKLPKGFLLGADTLATTIEPGESDTFEVRVDTSKVGLKTGQVTFASNDSNENPFNFSISANVVAFPQPEITVFGNGISIIDHDATPSAVDFTDFGAANVGATGTIRTFTVTNTGITALNISNFFPIGGGFTIVEPLASSIAVGQSDTFQVQLDTSTTGIKSGLVSFTTNDPDETQFDFAITGIVTMPVNGLYHATAAAEPFLGSAGVDTVSYDLATTGVVANLLSPAANTGFAAGDTYLGIENLTGSAQADRLTGDAGDNILEGGAGADAFDGGLGFDAVSYEHSGIGVTANLAASKSNTGDALGDTYRNIDALIGSNHDDHLVAGKTATTLSGLDGNDELTSGAGIDNLYGGLGADTFRFSSAKGLGDVIHDFQSGDGDTIGILKSAFKLPIGVALGTNDALDFELHYFVSNAAGTAATETGHGQFVYDRAADNLWWDADGAGSKAGILVAHFATDVDLQAAHFNLI